MNIPINTLVSTLAGLFLLLAVGFGAVRAGLLSSQASGHFSALLMKITIPATILAAMLRPFDPAFLRDSVIIIALGIGLFLLYALLSIPAARLFRVKETGRGMWKICCTFCNNGSMGFPLILALFGEDGLALAAMLNISFMLLIYTLGVKQVLSDKPGVQGATSWRAILCTEVNAATALGLLIFCLQFPVPALIITPVQLLSDITAPLSMLVIGMTLARGSLRDAFLDKDVCSASLMRLILLPVLTWGILRLLPLPNPLVTSVVLLTMAMPCPGTSTVLAEQYDTNAEFSSRMVFVSSLLCLATIPLITLLP